MAITVAPEDLRANSDAAPVSAAERRQATLAQLLALGQDAQGLDSRRRLARESLTGQGIPSTREESWRFTDLAPLLDGTYVSGAATTEAAWLQPLLLEDAPLRLVFLDGRFAPQFSTQELPAGLSFGTAVEGTDIATLPGAEELFARLNTAGFAEAAVLRVARNVRIEQPLHLLFVSTSETGDRTSFSQPRCWVQLESGAELTLVEDYAPLGNDCTAHYFVNAVTEIELAENACLHHSRVQRDGDRSFHIGRTAVRQARDSRYHGVTVSNGGRISRHNWEVFHTGSQVETTLNGLNLANGDQLSDTHSGIFYSYPDCRSQQLHKCIVDGRARTVFNGKVDVPQAAQRTDAAQLSRNLILSPQARVDTKPELEIVADDVKCSHGATVSQLREDELFYLQSRGLGRDAAVALLIDAFAGEILQQLPLASLREELARCVSCRA